MLKLRYVIVIKGLDLFLRIYFRNEVYSDIFIDKVSKLSVQNTDNLDTFTFSKIYIKKAIEKYGINYFLKGVLYASDTLSIVINIKKEVEYTYYYDRSVSKVYVSYTDKYINLDKITYLINSDIDRLTITRETLLNNYFSIAALQKIKETFIDIVDYFAMRGKTIEYVKKNSENKTFYYLLDGEKAIINLDKSSADFNAVVETFNIDEERFLYNSTILIHENLNNAKHIALQQRNIEKAEEFRAIVNLHVNSKVGSILEYNLSTYNGFERKMIIHPIEKNDKDYKIEIIAYKDEFPVYVEYYGYISRQKINIHFGLIFTNLY